MKKLRCLYKKSLTIHTLSILTYIIKNFNVETMKQKESKNLIESEFERCEKNEKVNYYCKYMCPNGISFSSCEFFFTV